jgi:hypothetical protein
MLPGELAQATARNLIVSPLENNRLSRSPGE